MINTYISNLDELISLHNDMNILMITVSYDKE